MRDFFGRCYFEMYAAKVGHPTIFTPNTFPSQTDMQNCSEFPLLLKVKMPSIQFQQKFVILFMKFRLIFLTWDNREYT